MTSELPLIGGSLIRNSGQSEIEDLHAAVGRDKDVFRLQIAMDNSFGVSCREGIRNGRAHLRNQFRWTRRALQLLTQGLSLQ